MKYIGRYDRRRKDGSPSGDRENAFVTLWQKENRPPDHVNGGCDILKHLLHAKHNDVAPFYEFDGDLTHEEATNATTVIQWLGTNRGWSFLEQVIEKCGYKLVRKDYLRELQAKQRTAR